MPTCYLTGATGCLGRNLLDELLKQNWDVTVLHRGSSDLSRLEGCDVTLRQVDLHDHHSVLAAIKHPADAIFHCAANTSHHRQDESDQWRDNVDATENLITAAMVKVRRFIYTSTGAVNLKDAKCGYVLSKRNAEYAVGRAVEHGLDAVILRPEIIIGKYDYNSYSQLFAAIQFGKLTKAFPGAANFCHAGNVAAAHVSAYHHGQTGEIYTMVGARHSWVSVFQKINDLLGIDRRVEAMTPRETLWVSRWMGVASWFNGDRPLLTEDLLELLTSGEPIDPAERDKSFNGLAYVRLSMETALTECYDWLCQTGRLKKERDNS